LLFFLFFDVRWVAAAAPPLLTAAAAPHPSLQTTPPLSPCCCRCCRCRRRPRREGTPQCFLLTPKLLPGLPYSRHITVLSIFNGAQIAPETARRYAKEALWGGPAVYAAALASAAAARVGA